MVLYRKLNQGDTLYFWTYVVYNGLGYRQDEGAHVVTSYDNQRS